VKGVNVVKPRQDKMTSKERMEALWNRQKPDRVALCGLDFAFSNKNAGYTVRSGYDDPQKTFEAKQWTAEQYGWDVIPWTIGHVILGGWDFGGIPKWPESEFQGALMIETPPVEVLMDKLNVSPEEAVEKLEMPDPRTAGGIQIAMEYCKLEAEHGLPVVFFPRSPMTSAANISGVEKFCKWTIKRPELCHKLVRMDLDHIFNVLQIWIDTFGAEKIIFSMSSPNEANQVISPKRFQEFAIPYHIELFERLRDMEIKRICFHICGEQNANLPFIAEELSPLWPHPTILSFGHEVDIEVAGKTFPEDIILGNVEPATIQIARPEEVYELCRIAIEKGKKCPGGFILAPGCELPITSPPVNVFQMTKAVNDFGWYE